MWCSLNWYRTRAAAVRSLYSAQHVSYQDAIKLELNLKIQIKLESFSFLMLLQTFDVNAFNAFVIAQSLVFVRNILQMNENMYMEIKSENTVPFIFNSKTLLWYLLYLPGLNSLFHSVPLKENSVINIYWFIYLGY